MKPTPKATSILTQNLYATLATVDSNGNPWNAPVYFVFDENYNLYWASSMQSQHSQNIYANGKVFIVVYDSSVPWGTGGGVYLETKAVEVTDPQEIAKACKLRKARVPEANQPPEDFMGDRPRRIYRATLRQIWTNEDGKINDHFVDVRVEASI